jgi:NAD(P)H-dependent FMN reductase
MATATAQKLLVFYGSYRTERAGIRLAHYLVDSFNARGARAELVDAKALNLPMLDKRYKDYPKDAVPTALEELAEKIRTADAFVFVAGEYNWGPQPGLKNLTDHFFEEFFWRPAAIASYSAGRLGGSHSNLFWHGTLNEMGMVVTSSTITVGGITHTIDADNKPIGDGGAALERSFGRFADDLAWWTDAVINQRKVRPPPF